MGFVCSLYCFPPTQSVCICIYSDHVYTERRRVWTESEKRLRLWMFLSVYIVSSCFLVSPFSLFFSLIYCQQYQCVMLIIFNVSCNFVTYIYICQFIRFSPL